MKDFDGKTPEMLRLDRRTELLDFIYDL